MPGSVTPQYSKLLEGENLRLRNWDKGIRASRIFHNQLRAPWFLLLLLVSEANAGEVLVRYGFGSENAVKPNTNQKILEGVVRQNLWGTTKLNLQGGFYTDATRDLRSAFAFATLGPRADLGAFYIENYFGAGVIEETDDLLGSHFQFAIDIGFGFQSSGTTIGLNFKHLSNAGIFPGPNQGRNFWQISVGVPF